MVEIKNKQIIIDNRPVLIMCGEIHYFRLPREEWRDRINKLKDAGCNAVAAYIPWLCHESTEGSVDLTGRTRPELNLLGFIDLCAECGLYFFLRPGPFIMAEMKNEGIPYWVYEKHPEIVPITWDGAVVPTKTVDYNAPGFLAEADKWLTAVFKEIRPRLQPNGGNIIAIQLDNEIGMLSWVSNAPDLTDHVIRDFRFWLSNRYGKEKLKDRYSLDLSDDEAIGTAFRQPAEVYAAAYHQDLGAYMRHRFARYAAYLRSIAEGCGIRDIPFVINIHGTSGGRAFTYPIGISQLYPAYTQGTGYLSGSDIYLGNLTMDNFQDLYIINGFMDAVHLPDQPLTSVEFECGDGNYGETLGGRYDPSAADFKTRMCIAQGSRLINYYLFAGGFNYPLEQKPNDGNDRIAFTGERHGFAAPVSPEGKLNYTYPKMAQTIRSVMAVSEMAAVMNEERDRLAFGFIPDYYMTEYRYPNSIVMKQIFENIEANRAYGSWEIPGRAVLLAGYRFGSADIQNKPLTPQAHPVLILPSARYMHRGIQQKLADYLNTGGRLLLYGEVPLFDMEGLSCEVLAEALGVKVKGFVNEARYYYLSVYASDWAAPRPEVRVSFAQTFHIQDQTPILRICGSGDICAFDAQAGRGRAIVIAASYTCDIGFFKTALERLGAVAGLTHDCPRHGIFMTSAASADGRFLHILNLDGFDKSFHITDGGQPLLGGREFVLRARDGVMLPLNLTVGSRRIAYATAEITEISEASISFRLTQPQDVIAFELGANIAAASDYKVFEAPDKLLVVSAKDARVDDQLTVYFHS